MSPIRLSNSESEAIVFRAGQMLKPGCFAYLSLSSRWIKKVWPAADCASSRSQRSYCAGAVVGC